uniref:ABC transmembrane type-2 domain-containing protein n=1 Tax=Taenioma perpusillum TaxID=210852 RepID=A0A1Z1MS28_9FLOR|nr:hypothetical protein [Taenioma perpusillum]ARW68571.1 hypothetical protein [Taenioma perpusillum]
MYLYNKYTNKNKNYLIPKYTRNFPVKKDFILTEIKAFIRRLYIQVCRKPYNIIVGIIQPLLWLILFGALFQNAPTDLFGQYNIKYIEFLSYGIMIFTGFTSSINAGLPIIFDREFGFFNRLLISPLKNKNSLFYSLILYTVIITNLQTVHIIYTSMICFNKIYNFSNIIIISLIAILIIINISNLSISFSLILPGHIEFLAFTLLINLPTLFSSTALAPLSFMPYWLQFIACINPLTYAIEIIRNICINNKVEFNNKIIETIWFQLSIKDSLILLFLINIISIVITKKILKHKYN